MFPQHQTHKLGSFHCIATKVTVGIDFSAIQDIEFLMTWMYFCIFLTLLCSRSQCPRGLRRRPTAARLLRSWIRIPLEAWMSVCECCVLSGRGLCDELTTRPEESYRLWCVAVCDLETSYMRIQTSINCDWTLIGDTSLDVSAACH
jgi:hypothetical protein